MKRKICRSHIKIKIKLFKNKVILAQCSFRLKTREHCQDKITSKSNNIIIKRVLIHLIEYYIQRALIVVIKHNLQIIKVKQIRI
jgi:hypothetical protein